MVVQICLKSSFYLLSSLKFPKYPHFIFNFHKTTPRPTPPPLGENVGFIFLNLNNK